MEGFQDEEFLSIQKRILSELEGAGEKGMSNEELFNSFIEGKKFGIEILYETAMFSLENCGYISEIQNDASNNFENKNSIVYHLTPEGYKLIEFYK